MKSVYKIQVVLKYDKGNCYFTLNPIQIYDYICLNAFISLKFQTEFVEEFKM
jgi:hypothetical protein